MTYQTVITNYGEQLIANAIANNQPVLFKTMAIGDGNGKPVQPTQVQTALVNEVYRTENASIYVDNKKPTQAIFEILVPEDVGEFWVREFGLFDDKNNLVAVANCPDSYKSIKKAGSGKVQIYRMVLEISSSDAVELIINDNAVYLTREAFDNFKSDLNNPDGFKMVGQCESIEQLRTIEPTEDNQRILVRGYYAGSNIGGGEFYADINDKKTVDNDGTIIVTTGNNRWIKLIDGVVKFSDFGVKAGKAVVNQTTAKINAAFKFAYDYKISKVINDIPGDYYLSNFMLIGDNLEFENVDGVKYLRAGHTAMMYNGLSITPASSAEKRARNITIRGGVFDSNATEYWSAVNFMSLGYIDGLHIDGVTFVNCIRNHAIDMSACSNVLVENCKFLGFSAEKTTKYGTAPDKAEDRSYAEAIQIDDNQVGTFSGGQLKGDPNTNITIRNNLFSGNYDDTTGLFSGGYGCAIGGHYAARSGKHHKNITIDNNIITDCGYAGIRPFLWDDVKITNNTFVNNRRNVYIWWLTSTETAQSDAGKNYHISGNDFGDVVAEQITTQIFGNEYKEGFAKVDSVIITDNKFGNTEWEGALIKLQGANNVIVSSNLFDDAKRFIDVDYCSHVTITGNAGNTLSNEFFASKNNTYQQFIGKTEHVLISNNIAQQSAGGVLYLHKMQNVNVLNNTFTNIANTHNTHAIRAIEVSELYVDNNIIMLVQSAVDANVRALEVAADCTNINIGGIITNSTEIYRSSAPDLNGINFGIANIKKSQINSLTVGANSSTARNLAVNGSAIISGGLTVGDNAAQGKISFFTAGYAQAQTPANTDKSQKLATTEWVRNFSSSEKVLWLGSSTNAVSIDVKQQAGVVYIVYDVRGFEKFDSFVIGSANNAVIGQLEYGGENADRPYNSLIRITVSGTTLTMTPEGGTPPTIKKVILIGA
ncbi:phage tail-collar fiber domain-containing protein [Actinobacillus lignieresii]|uniref:Plasmin and fibronectin-binding protein A n=1 Tax=Actinobacillus lignieresii TaxID=720 RepID=A0A380TT23_ACTLI|nr:phage tail protein [Actinobacillus lignieresii]SUT91531.1 Plasmin and fibronectin-binding protein A precursor [Actinobacillus lignieresii]